MLAAARASSAFRLTTVLAFASLIAAQSQVNPPSDQSAADRLLASMHDYAERYVGSLPDFICLQTTDQFQAGKKADHWHQLDSLTSKLVFAKGREHRTLELVNGRKPSGLRLSRRPLITEGEFAILISNIFGENSHAQFSWQGWQTVKGQRCAVFRYRIEQEHSTMKLSLSDLVSATVPYGGTVIADATTGVILRVTSEATEIPAEIRTRSIATTIEYGPVAVGASTYQLPSDASVELETSSGRIRNELHFRNYQKFEAESTITFESDNANSGKRPNPPPQ